MPTPRSPSSQLVEPAQRDRGSRSSPAVVFAAFLVGLAIPVVFFLCWELVRFDPTLRSVSMIGIVALAPGLFAYFLVGEASLLGGYLAAALANGGLYGLLAWGCSRVPRSKMVWRFPIVLLPFLIWWSPWIVSEFFGSP